MTPFRTGCLALLTGVLVLGCGDTASGPVQPVPGPLQVVLTSPNADDGAVMFQVIGVVDSVRPAAGVSVYQNAPGANILRVIATGDGLVSGASLLTLYVPDVNRASTLTFHVLQVAAKGSYAARATSGYSLKATK